MILLAAALALAPAAASRFGFRGFVTTYALAAAAWLPLRSRSLPARWIFIIAIVLRSMLLVPEPQLSGDVYRYVWDGKVLRHGVNPYRYAPDDARLASLRETWHSRINHPEIRTIYPPVAEMLFIAAMNERVWRVLLVLADLAILA
ncbi:MAG TPA: hypothetical protein VFN10_00210, partial [Thermoanaerobaculia bacterium]|nr:hypothetical protein [Thermoanaerobaculia bacterium]